MYRDIELAKALSKLPLLKEVDELKHQIDALRPLPREAEERVLQKFRLDWNYHSNAIEGNPYTYGETVAFLMEGITAKGKTLKDHLDIKGHDDAIQYLLSVVKDKDYRLTESEIRALHKMLLKEPYFSDAITADGFVTKKEIKLGVYKSMPNHVKTPTGAIHYYASPEETPIKMGELVEWYNKVSEDRAIHPVVIASLFHHEFTAIHPFDDGNGRMARLLMNLILMQRGFPPVLVKQEDRNNYYQALRQADVGEYPPIVEYISEGLVHSLKVYLKGAKGESVEDEDDIDKAIALFKKQLSEDKPVTKKSTLVINDLFAESLIPLAENVKDKANKLADVFFEIKDSFTFLRNNSPQIDLVTPLRNFPGNIATAKFDLELKGYKKVDDPFNCHAIINFHFGEFTYELSVWPTPAKSYKKKYPDQLNKQEIVEITKTVIDGLLREIKEKSNEQEKNK